jgi:hypothetical protein
MTAQTTGFPGQQDYLFPDDMMVAEVIEGISNCGAALHRLRVQLEVRQRELPKGSGRLITRLAVCENQIAFTVFDFTNPAKDRWGKATVRRPVTNGPH